VILRCFCGTDVRADGSVPAPHPDVGLQPIDDPRVA